MANGISVFIGMNYLLNDNLKYIKQAKLSGFTRVFTSLHIPEANYQQIVSDFTAILDLCKQLNMAVIADISPNAFSYLNIKLDNLKQFKDLGLSGIRLDYGFSPDKIAEYSRNYCDLLIELNASTMTLDFFEQIIIAGANTKNLSACHNYYPRLNTGISETSLLDKNKIFQRHGIPVSAFIALPDNKRGPLYDGLPTLEFTRTISPIVAYQILALLGIDNIYIGDAIADNKLLSSIKNLSQDIISLELFNYNSEYLELLSMNHTNRPDSAEDVVRSQESRLVLLQNIYNSKPVKAHDCNMRKLGSVTVDNSGYLRYSGELQIVKRDLIADPRVNIIGNITLDSVYLLKYINDNQLFNFIFQN